MSGTTLCTASSILNTDRQAEQEASLVEWRLLVGRLVEYFNISVLSRPSQTRHFRRTVKLYKFLLDAIASPSIYPCQWVSQ